MKDNEKLLFNMNVGVDVVACDYCDIEQGSILKLDVLESHDCINICSILESFGIDFKEAMKHVFLRVYHLVSYDTKFYVLKCFVQVCYSEEVV